jgi:hypothetical protein
MYKVKAVYDYASPHEDDLDFKVGQIISVTEEEGDDWYVGEYTDDNGTKRDGLFPRNFVERYEPAPPPRPNRAPRPKPLEQAVAQEALPMPQMPPQEPEPVQREGPEASKPQPPPLEVPQAAKATPLPMSPMSSPSPFSARAQEPPPVQQESSKPAPAAKKPPPVAAKSNAFRDRIAAFNAPAAAPIQPFKPSGGAPTSFIKKPFVAPPPSRNAYVPPSRDPPQQIKTYRREEDPEIAERRAQDQNDAERAGLAPQDAPKDNEAEEQQQPKVSLKERIALLQKQQQEQAERAAAMHKEKPKRPPVAKRTESQDAHAEDSEDAGLERVASGASKGRVSMDHSRPSRASTDIRSPESQHRQPELMSENDADQSGAGETTEDGGGESTSVEDDEARPKSRHAPPPPPARAAAAPAQEADVGDEQDVAEEEAEEEDEMDAEARRKLELRERMAKMSGGMGMPGMFGGMPMGGLPPKKKKKPTIEKRAEESEEYASPQQRVPMFGMPGMSSVRSPEQVRSPEPEDRELSVEKEDEVPQPVTGTHQADEVPDVEDLAPQPIQRTLTGDRPPPVPSESKFLIPRKPIDVFARHISARYQLPSPETVSKTYTAFDGVSEYVMTVCVSSMLVQSTAVVSQWYYLN